MTTDLLHNAQLNKKKDIITSHPLFMHWEQTSEHSATDLAFVLGQWYYPISYFPTFLSRLISNFNDIDIQAHISRILWQELGQGIGSHSHVSLYLTTVKMAGFDPAVIATAEALPTTKRLIEGYRNAAESCYEGLGVLYGTEVIDLTMVSAVGKEIDRVVGKKMKLPWVTIHLQQEPDHVSSVDQIISKEFDEPTNKIISNQIEKIWLLWEDFWSGIQKNRGV